MASSPSPFTRLLDRLADAVAVRVAARLSPHFATARLRYDYLTHLFSRIYQQGERLMSGFDDLSAAVNTTINAVSNLSHDVDIVVAALNDKADQHGDPELEALAVRLQTVNNTLGALSTNLEAAAPKQQPAPAPAPPAPEPVTTEPAPAPAPSAAPSEPPVATTEGTPTPTQLPLATGDPGDETAGSDG